MGYYKEDTDKNVGTIFFIILFLLFTLVFSDNSESQTSVSPGYPVHYELVSGNISIHSDATVFSAVIIPDLYKICLFTLKHTGPDLFPSQNIISWYNHRTTQDFIAIQRTRLEIEPLLLWRINYPLSSGEKEALPVLS